MLDKGIKPRQQWTENIYAIPLTYNNKLVHSATEMTPKESSKEDNELDVYVNLKLKAKHSRKYPAITVGDKVHIYAKKNHSTNLMSCKAFTTCKVEGSSLSHGLTLYRTSSRQRPFLRHKLTSTSTAHMVSLLTNRIALISSAIVAVDIKALTCYYNDLDVIVRLHRQATSRRR